MPRNLRNSSRESTRKIIQRKLLVEQMEARSLLAADAAFWMAFEGAAEDLIGSNEGALQGNVQFINGHSGTAAKLSGNESINILKQTGALDFGAGNFTIETWIKADAVQSGGSTSLVLNYGGLSYYQMAISIGGRLRLDCRDSAGNSVATFDDAADSVNLLDSNWHHVAASRDGSTFSIYVDGVLRKSTSQSIGAILTANSYVRIGGSNSGPGNSTSPVTNEPANNFRGVIDELTIYPRALTPLEIARAYNPPVLPVLAFDSPVSLADSGPGYGIGHGDFNQDGIIDIASANYGTGSLNVFLGQGHGGYGNRVVYPVGGSPSSVAVGDIDGDGKLDLATGTYSGHTLIVLFGNGDGTFSDLRSWSNSFDPVDVKIADMNNDGHSDLVAGNYWYPGGSVTVLLGAPGRSFQSPLNYTASNGTESVALSDFDGDGDIDVATADYHAGTMSVMLNNGSGTLAAPVAYASGALAVWIDSADFNRDGYVDLVVSNYAGSNVSVFLGNGNGTFRPAARYALGSAANVVRVGDLNGDGLVDLAVSLSTANRVGILPGVGDGTFSTLTTFVTGSEPYGLTLADFDGNGTKDIATANYAGANVSILKNLGVLSSPYLSIITPATSTLGTPFTVTVSALHPNGLTATNFTGTIQFKSSDRFAQLPADYSFTEADQGVKTFAVMFQSAGNQTLSATLIGSNGIVAGKVVSVAAPLVGDILFNSASTLNLVSGNAAVAEPADFDGDGFLDLATVNEATNTISITLGLGNGTFGVGVTYATGQGPARSASADLNGDGKLDLLVANYAGGSLSLLFGLGNGTFLPAQSISSLPGVYDVGIGDFNHDGVVDIAADSLSQNGVFILIGNGGGNYLPPVFYATANGSHHVTVADLDGDGALDLLTANYFDSNIVVLYGNKSSGVPNGIFGNRQVLAAGLNTFDLIAVDFNGDGKIDIATTNRGDGTSTIYRGLGARQFLQMPSLSVGPQPYHLVSADYNNDGRSDLAFASLTSHQVTLFAGNGDLTFQPKGSLGLTYAYRLATGDFNLDGKVDLVASAAGNGVLQTWLGVGALTASAGGPYSVAAGTALFLDGTNSSTATNRVLTYQWDLDYDGLAFQADTTGRTALFDASQMVGGQQRTVALRVTDSSGFSSTSVTTVSFVELNSELDGVALATEELVNTTTSRDQMYPALAMNKDGNSVVVYESGSNGTLDLDILAQRYNASGTKVGGEAQVNLGAFDERVRPGVAMADDGRYIVAWQGWAADAQGWGVNAQRFDKDGNRVGNQFIVNVGWESGYQVEVDLAISPDGTKFVVVWEDSQNDGSGQGVFASLFDWNSNLPNGGLLNTRLVNNYTSGAQDSADVEMLATGGFVVTWASQYQDGSGYGIFARRFNASGNPIDPTDIQINRFTEGTQTQPDLVTTSDGQEYVISWQTALSNRVTDIVAQRFDSNFNRIGAEFIVNETSAGYQYFPAVAISSNGFVTFTWTSPGQDGSGFGIFARTMGPGSNQLGHEFQINSVSVGDQNTRGSRQSIAYTPTGETVVTWWGNGPGDNVGVFQRRFASHNHVVSPITDANTLPNQIAENSAIGSDVGIRALALDPDLFDTVTYSLDDSAGNRFAINPTTGVITVAGAIDRETAASYDVIVRAKSTDTSFTTKAFTIAVVDVDEFDTSSIIDVNTIVNTVRENAPNGTLVNITAFASDADATNNGITYSLDDSAGGRFAIDPATGIVSVAGAIDYEANTSHTIVTRATSADGSFSTASFVISVQDVNEGIVFSGSAGNDTLKFWPGPIAGQFYFKRNAEANLLFTANGSVTVNGGGGTDTLIIEGTNLTNQFDIYADRVRYGNVDFYGNQIATRQINALGSGDTINAYGGTASINGGSAVDRLVALTPGNQVWSITAPNAGNLNGQIFFTSVESLIGSDGDDQFLVGPSGSVSGRIDGGIGLNTLDYTDVTTALSFNLQTGAATKTGGTSNIARVIGGSAIDTLTAADVANQWTIGGGGSGTINGSFSFNGIENLAGGSLFDVFTIGNASLVMGNLSGGGGVDSIEYQSNENLIVNLASSTASKIGGTISSVEQIALGAGADTVVGRNVTSNWNITGANAVTTSGVAFQNVETLVGGSGTDTLIGTAQNNQWNVDNSNAGRLGGLVWSGVENLTGGTGDDAFLIAGSASVSGIINGGNGFDVLDYRAFGASVTVDLSIANSTGVGKFASISTIFGSATNDRIIGADNANTWSFTASGGVVDGLAFESFETWQGGTGIDSLSGPNTAMIWSVTGANSGNVANVSFASMENLIGKSQLDTFAFQANGSVSGQINGGLGEDVLDYSASSAAIVVNLLNSSTSAVGSFSSISALIGSPASDTLLGANSPNTWTITTSTTFTVGSLSVGNFESLVGGTGVDVFRAKEGVEYFGSIDGGAGVDRMEYTAFVSSVSVNLSLGAATGFASVSRIENITGGNSDDLLVGDASDNVISGGNGDDVLFGMAGNDTLNGNIGRDLLFGGSGADLIRGSSGEDILIGGLTNYAQEASGIVNRTAIDAIMMEWRRIDSPYAQRIARLNGLAQGGLNGSYFLNASTLIDDEEVDDLWGDAGLDWFWAGLGDVVHFTSGEDVENH